MPESTVTSAPVADRVDDVREQLERHRARSSWRPPWLESTTRVGAGVDGCHARRRRTASPLTTTGPCHCSFSQAMSAGRSACSRSWLDIPQRA